MKLITHHFSLTIEYKNGGIINEKAKNGARRKLHLRESLQVILDLQGFVGSIHESTAGHS